MAASVREDYSPSNIEYDVTVGDGKYRYQMNKAGRSRVLRDGEPWGRNVVGDGFVLSLVQEIDDLKNQLTALKNEEIEQIVSQSDRQDSSSTTLVDDLSDEEQEDDYSGPR